VRRCDSIPLINKEAARVHQSYPPRRPTLHVSTPISRQLLLFFANIASSLETLEVEVGPPGGRKTPGLMYQMLTLAAVRAPRLRWVTVLEYDLGLGPLAESVALLGQIERLQIGGCELPSLRSSNSLRNLAGLRSLKAPPPPHLSSPSKSQPCLCS